MSEHPITNTRNQRYRGFQEISTKHYISAQDQNRTTRKTLSRKRSKWRGGIICSNQEGAFH